MKRRTFLRRVAVGSAGVGAITLAACAPAAQNAASTGAQAPAQGADLPQLSWDMPTSWGPSIPVAFGAAQRFAQRVGELTSGRFVINAAPAGQIVPGLQVYDAIEAGTVKIGHTASFYWVGRDPAWAIGTGLPFGLTTQANNAWLYGPGRPLLDEFYAEQGIVAFPAGNTTQQMGGWFKKEVNTLADLQGLKMRIPGLGGRTMERLGVLPQVLAGGEIFQALSSGTIDAAEFIGPVEEEMMGLQNAASFYMYPGWWEPSANLDVFVNKTDYDALPDLYKSAIQAAAAEACARCIAEYDAQNQAALQRLVAGGVTLKPFSSEIMAAAQTAAFEIYAESAASSTFFARLYENWQQFRGEVFNWHKTNEFAYMEFAYNNPVA